VSYDGATAELRYDGSGKGNDTAIVQLEAPSLGAGSAQFRIRVLQPTIAWASTRGRGFRASGSIPPAGPVEGDAEGRSRAPPTSTRTWCS
jgi:hypothetical protein